MSLYARLAEHNVGTIDWEQHVPAFFARIQKNFNLPVTYKHINVGNKGVMVSSVTSVKWIVYSLGGASSTQLYLSRMFDCLESYYHTANHGSHSLRLAEFLGRLVSMFVRRLHRERYSKERWGYVVAEKHKLTDEDVAAFVQAVKPATLLAMYSKISAGEIGGVLQQLATLSPQEILPPLIDRMNASLETLTEPHKLT